VNLLEVMLALHRWTGDPDASTNRPYVYRLDNPATPEAKPNYLLTAAELQRRIFAEAASVLSPDEVPPLFQEIASALGLRLVHRAEVPDYGAFEFYPLNEPAPERPQIETVSPPPVPPYTPASKPTEPQRRIMAIEDDRILEKQGTRYFPLSLASQYGNVPRTTLTHWIKAKTEVQGSPLNVYESPTAHKSFVAEESVQRVARRFIKWRDGKPAGPAGPVTVGKTKDKSGYVGIAKAAKTIGVATRTMWLWATQEDYKPPTGEPLDVIRCTASEQFYIRESEVAKLKKLVPKSGLRRGPRPLSLQ